MVAIKYFLNKILDECKDENASWMAIRSYVIEILRIIESKEQ